MVNSGGGWLQTGSVLIAVVAASVSTVLWITNQNDKLAQRLVTIEFNLAKLEARVAEGGWSFRQHILWIEELRKHSDHEVPSAAKFPFSKITER